MAGNFIPMVYAVLKDKGVDTSKMTTEQAIEKYNELIGKTGRFNVVQSEREEHIKLPQKEYAAVCSAINTKFANKVPKEGTVLHGNYYYSYSCDNSLILFHGKIQIEGNEDLIDFLEGYSYDRNRKRNND